jgi:hypothetical protein
VKPSAGNPVRFDFFKKPWSYLRAAWWPWLLVGFPLFLTFPAWILGSLYILQNLAAGGGSPIVLGLVGSAVFGAMGFLVLVLQQMMLGGLVNMALRQQRGEQVRICDAYPMKRAGGLFVLVSLNLSTVLTGFATCLLPGFVLLGMTMFSYAAYFEENLGPFQAFARGFILSKPRLDVLAGLGTSLYGIAYASVLLPIVGPCMAFPLQAISIAYNYRIAFPGESERRIPAG